jgi:hypothetical protein
MVFNNLPSIPAFTSSDTPVIFPDLLESAKKRMAA